MFKMSKLQGEYQNIYPDINWLLGLYILSDIQLLQESSLRERKYCPYKDFQHLLLNHYLDKYVRFELANTY